MSKHLTPQYTLPLKGSYNTQVENHIHSLHTYTLYARLQFSLDLHACENCACSEVQNFKCWVAILSVSLGELSLVFSVDYKIKCICTSNVSIGWQ